MAGILGPLPKNRSLNRPVSRAPLVDITWVCSHQLETEVPRWQDIGALPSSHPTVNDQFASGDE